MKINILHTAIKPLALAALAATMLASCDKFLEETSQDEFEPKNTESFAELLQGQGYPFFSTLDGLTNLMSDDVMGVKSSEYNYDKTRLAYKDVFAWQPYMHSSVAMGSTMYKNLYAKIMVCNMITELAPGSAGSQADKDQVVGEALALRAYYYFQLVNLFAKPYNAPGTTPEQSPGVTLSLKSEVLDEGMPRHSVREVYARITADIEEAIALLERHRKNNGAFRISHTAARLFASRVYLYMEDWDQVIAHAGKALESAPGLVHLPDYALSNTMNPNNGPISSRFPETIFVFQGVDATYGLYGPYAMSGDLSGSLDGTDSRKSKFMNLNAYYGFYQSSKAGTSEMGNAWRTAELYLNRAEAYAMKYKAGHSASGPLAVADLNALRSKRFASYADYVLTTADALETFCREERRRELFFEGHRWFDLRRYGMPQIKHTWVDATGTRTVYTLNAQDPAYVLPIPEDILQRNRTLTQNELAAQRIGSAE